MAFGGGEESDSGAGPHVPDSAPAPDLLERQTDDYLRHRTTTLFAALNVSDDKVMAKCLPLHRRTEFLQFLDRIERQTAKG